MRTAWPHAISVPVAFRGYGEIGVNPLKSPVEIYIANFPWGKYMPHAGGADVCVSSWNRLAPNTMPSLAKAGANYMNSQLIRMEAEINGYAEGIALDRNGYLSEGSGENLFLIREGKIFTSPLANSVLNGITRASVIQIAKDFGIEVVEQALPREMLYLCDEAFFTGTAAEVSHLRSVDRILIGDGSMGPVTKKLHDEFFALVNGTQEDRYGWLTPVSSEGRGACGRVTSSQHLGHAVGSFKGSPFPACKSRLCAYCCIMTLGKAEAFPAELPQVPAALHRCCHLRLAYARRPALASSPRSESAPALQRWALRCGCKAATSPAWPVFSDCSHATSTRTSSMPSSPSGSGSLPLIMQSEKYFSSPPNWSVLLKLSVLSSSPIFSVCFMPPGMAYAGLLNSAPKVARRCGRSSRSCAL